MRGEKRTPPSAFTREEKKFWKSGWDQGETFLKTITVTTEVFVQETGKFEPREVKANVALKALNDDIAELVGIGLIMRFVFFIYLLCLHLIKLYITKKKRLFYEPL